MSAVRKRPAAQEDDWYPDQAAEEVLGKMVPPLAQSEVLAHLEGGLSPNPDGRSGSGGASAPPSPTGNSSSAEANLATVASVHRCFWVESAAILSVQKTRFNKASGATAVATVRKRSASGRSFHSPNRTV